jgi:hypothetical protein
MEGSELTSKFERRTPMENIEYCADKAKAERDAVEDQAATARKSSPVAMEDCSSKQVVLSQDEICWREENITNE